MRQASPIVAPLSLFAVFAGLCLGAPETTSAKPPAAAPSCGQRGRVVFDKDAVLLDASGKKLARFSGGESAVTLVAPPMDGTGLLRIETGTGRGSFRIKGLLEARQLRLYTTARVPLASGHVWLAAGTRVVAVGADGGKVQIEKRLSPPFEQTVSAHVECGGLGFAAGHDAEPPLQGTARIFLLREPRLDLFDSVPPTSTPSFTLVRSPAVESARLFSREQRGGFVHVQYEGEIVVDAWAKASDLHPLPRGELLEPPRPSYVLSTPPRLELAELPRVVTVDREVPLRLAAKDAEAAIGVIEPDTEVYVMDVLGGWAKVLPKSLHVLPDGDRAFWAKSSDLRL